MTTAELNPRKAMEAANRIPPMPYDLLGPIFEHLKDNKASLCAISLASNTFRQEAQCILFREFTASFNRKKSLAFLRAVVASPSRLALFVHTYENRAYNMDPHDRVIAEQALKAMCNLKRLRLGGELLNDNMRILRDCTFRLERFDASASTSDAGLFEWFLPGQNMLKHLGLERYGEEVSKLPDDQWTPVGSCPQLVSIEGSWATIEVLLPGRKITTLSISDLYATNFQSLVELKYIKALSFSVVFIIGDSDLQNVSVLQHFSSLETLEITQFEDDWDLIRLEHTPLFFQTLSALQTLVLSGGNLELGHYIQNNDQSIPYLFKILGKNLKYIDVEVDWGVYTRYTRNSKHTEAISVAEARKVWLAEPIA